MLLVVARAGAVLHFTKTRCIHRLVSQAMSSLFLTGIKCQENRNTIEVGLVAERKKLRQKRFLMVVPTFGYFLRFFLRTEKAVLEAVESKIQIHKPKIISF